MDLDDPENGGAKAEERPQQVCWGVLGVGESASRCCCCCVSDVSYERGGQIPTTIGLLFVIL